MSATIATKKATGKARKSTKAASKAASKAAPKGGFDPRALPNYGKVRDSFLKLEQSACKSAIDWGQQFLRLLQSALKGKLGGERSNLRKQIVGALSADTGASDAKFSMCVKAATLAKWCADYGFDLSAISWSIVGFILAPLAKRDTESAGEVWVVDVHRDSAADLVLCLEDIAAKPIGRDKVKAMLEAADIRNGDGAPVWVSKGPKAPKESPQESPQQDLETSEAGESDANLPAQVSDCRKPGDFANRANAVLLACDDRQAALESLATVQGAQGVAYLQGLARWVANLDRDRDGRDAAAEVVRAALAVVRVAESAFPELQSIREQALSAAK